MALEPFWMQPHSVQPYLATMPCSSGAGDLVAQPAAVVRGDEFVELIDGQAALAPDVAQLEARVVVAGVLVVDQPHPVAVVDEVAGQQVVVARDGGLVGRPSAPVGSASNSSA